MMWIAIAMLLAQTAPSAAPGTAAAWKARGLSDISSGNMQAAVAALTKACDLDATDAESCYYLGRTLTGLARYEEAREPLQKALRAASRDFRAKAYRAVALNFAGLNLPREAESNFREAVRHYRGGKRPEEDPRIDYGAFLGREGRLSEALSLLRQAAAAHPDSWRAHAELGRALLHSGDPRKAASSLERAVALSPKAWEVRLLLGRAYLQMDRVEDAERELHLGREGWSASPK